MLKSSLKVNLVGTCRTVEEFRGLETAFEAILMALVQLAERVLVYYSTHLGETVNWEVE